MIKHFYIFRHGESTYNAAKRTQGRTNDSVLTEKGIKQAFNTGQKLKKFPVEMLVSSPLARAMQTSGEVLKSIHVPFKTDDRFIEVDVGEIEGMFKTEIREKFGEQYEIWRSKDEKYWDFCFKGGETKRQVKTRLFNALMDYVNNTDHTHIAISGHGIFLDQILLSLGHKVEESKNGAILHLIYDNGDWKVDEIL